jgi:murein DD-endopeptidase MepM/ murein hydrolase activator NlpD
MIVLLTLIHSIIKIHSMDNTVSINYANNAFPTQPSQSPVIVSVSKGSKTDKAISSNSTTYADPGKDFEKLLTVMLLASSLSSMNSSDKLFGNSESNDSSSSNLSSLMSPLYSIFSQMMQPSNVIQSSAINQYTSSSVPHMKPVEGVMTQDFHTGHIGIDTGIKVGTPIKATMDGKVVFAGWNQEGYGNLVVVENGKYKTYYAHQSELNVRTGDIVSAGTVVGLSGTTGNSTGPHLHYEVRVNGTPVDPRKYYGPMVTTEA